MSATQVFDVAAVSRDTVLAMLRTEDRLRKCDEMQLLYDACRDVVGDQVERFIQRNVLKKFGFAPSVENLERYWQIRAHYGDDDREVMESVIYLRYAHLLHDCTIPLGAPCPDADLFTLADEPQPVTLGSYMRQNERLVVLAGSMT